MTTRKIYYEDVYCKEFEATVLECQENKGIYKVVLDQTAFYPEGGGQPFDFGTIEGIEVIEVHEKEEIIYHTTEKPLEVGTKVTGKIDWERRFHHMQQHSGEHILSGLIHEHFGYDNVGFHMGSEGITVDFNGMLTAEDILMIEEKANGLIYDNVPVDIQFYTKEEAVDVEYRSKKEIEGVIRIVTFPGGDTCACCGTHVRYAGEIGLIKVISSMKYKSGVRLTMLCGKAALMDYHKRITQTAAISNLLSAKPELITDAVEKLLKDQSEKNFKIGQLYRDLFTLRAEQIEEGTKKLCLFEEDLSPALLRQLATILMEKVELVVVCSGTDESGYQYAAGSKVQDMKEYGKVLNSSLQGKGGGSKEMVQGTFFAKKEDIEKTIAKNI